MKDCWAARPDDRPDFSQILSKLELHQRIYVDFSEISSDYVFPPTKEQIQNNKLSNGLKHWNFVQDSDFENELIITSVQVFWLQWVFSSIKVNQMLSSMWSDHPYIPNWGTILLFNVNNSRKLIC